MRRARLKDAIRMGMDLSARVTALAPRPTVPRIFTYHEILPADEECPNPYNQVSASTLELQIDRLLEAGYRLVTVSRLSETLSGAAAEDGKQISLTFDDGLQEHSTLALPILRDRGVPATFYVLTGRFGETSPEGPHLTEDDVRRLADAGMEIGSHSRSHAVLSRLDSDRLVEEVEGSRNDLEKILGSAPKTFAYPYGSRTTYNEDVVEAVRRAGYTTAASTRIGANPRGTSLYELRRIPIYGTDDARLSAAKAHGAYDWTGVLQELWLTWMPHHSTRKNAI